MRPILRAFFHLLYHRLAWAYDLVAWIVSWGRWNFWVRSILQYLPNGRILEIGFGSGHLQNCLPDKRRIVYGVEESEQMIRITRRRMLRNGLDFRLVRGRAQTLPFGTASFDTITATFPAPFIFEEATAAEIARTLKPGGRLAALLAFRPSGRGLAATAIRTIFSLTGQLPQRDFDPQPLETAYLQARLQVQISWRDTTSGKLLLIDALKPLENHSHLG